MFRFEWHEQENETNRRKHGIDFETAQLVFEDPRCVRFVSNDVGGEERWTAIGSVEDIIILVFVHTYREQPPDEVIRIISARRATSHERRLYEQTTI
jgi:uncharacterized DUF497 family protein